jgi:hypothetical protein
MNLTAILIPLPRGGAAPAALGRGVVTGSLAGDDRGLLVPHQRTFAP